MKQFIKIMVIMFVVSVGNDISITALLNPRGINAGGATGLATVMSDWAKVSFALVYGVINVPILLFGARYLSIRFSVYTVVATALTIVLFPYLQPFTLQVHPILATGLGAIVYGASIGITYRFDFSLGGFALLAKVLEVVTHRKVGTIFTVINFVPVILSACTRWSPSEFFWSVLFIILTGEIINWTVMGHSYYKHCRIRAENTIRFPVKIYQSVKELQHVS